MSLQGLDNPNLIENIKAKNTINDTVEEKVLINNTRQGMVTRRTVANHRTDENLEKQQVIQDDNTKQISSWKRIVLLIIAITVHNIPGISIFH